MEQKYYYLHVRKGTKTSQREKTQEDKYFQHD